MDATAHRDRDEAIRASTEGAVALAARFGLSESQISRIRSGIPRPLTRRQEAEQVRAGGWRADCMDDEEWAHWLTANPMGLSDALVAARPCTDCPLGFAADMRAEGRCNGSPGWQPPADADDEAEEESEPREIGVIPLITLADSPIAPRKDESPMEATAEPIQATPSQSQVHALEELQSSALEALEAIQEHELAQVAITRAEEIREAALQRLTRAQQLVRDVLGSTPRDTSAAERRHEQLLHGDRPDPSTADPHPDWTTGRDEDPGVAPADVPDGILGGEPVDDAPETITRPARGENEARPLTARQAKVLELLEANGGDRAHAARELGIVYQSVDEMLEAIAKKGLLPIALIAKLPARFAKYSGVGA